MGKDEHKRVVSSPFTLVEGRYGDALIDAKQLAAKLGVKPPTIVGSYSKRPDFPAPVQWGGHKLKWRLDDVCVWIGSDLGPVPVVNRTKVKPQVTLRQALAKKLAGAQRRSRIKKRPCGITLRHLLDLHEAQGGVCAVSGIAFVLNEGEDGPFAPTIDRIDSLNGYEVGNVRLVCLSINLMMNKWGDNVFHAAMKSIPGNRLASTKAGI